VSQVTTEDNQFDPNMFICFTKNSKNDAIHDYQKITFRLHRPYL